MRAKSITGQSTEEIAAALHKSMEDGFIPTLAIIFISIRQDRTAVCQILHQHQIDIIGATSCSEFINDHQSEGQVVVMLLEINKQDYTIVFDNGKGKTSAESAQRIAADATSAFQNPSIILFSTCFSVSAAVYDGPSLIHTLSNIMGTGTEIYGGMAGDDGTLTGTFVFTADQATDDGVIALILNQDRIALYGQAISGWKPLGKIRTVTKSEDGWLYSIDGQPALEMYLRYLGQQLDDESGTQKVFYEDIGFLYPLLAIGAGEPVIRTPIIVDKDKNAIRLDSPIPEGKELQFMMPPDFDIVDTVLDSATTMQKQYNVEADALLIFSCAGRLSALGPMTQEENNGLAQVWRAPTAGFYTYGEFGRALTGKHEFHSTTCCWVALKEK